MNYDDIAKRRPVAEFRHFVNMSGVNAVNLQKTILVIIVENDLRSWWTSGKAGN